MAKEYSGWNTSRLLDMLHNTANREEDDIVAIKKELRNRWPFDLVFDFMEYIIDEKQELASKLEEVRKKNPKFFDPYPGGILDEKN